MGPCMDFLNWLEPDMSVKVLTCLDDPSDLVRIGSVSRAWRYFVIENGLCKKLCLRMFPQLYRVSRVVEYNSPEAKEVAEGGSSNSKEMETMEMEHRVYSFLAHGCMCSDVTNSVSEAISASSTDNYPEESIHNTLEPRDVVARRYSYWSSTGQRDPKVPEMLIYKLVSDFVVITEINIHPFQAFFQDGLPIYSASAVRFKMGHAKSPMDVEREPVRVRMGNAKSPVDEESDPVGKSCHENFIWTYTSPEFLMTQENRMQNFKLPEPVLCVGGILMIELLGRVQRQEMDDLFYICVSHVEIKGKSLSPAFGVEIHEPSGEFVLKNNMQAKCKNLPSLPEEEPEKISTVDLERHLRDMLPIMNLLRGNVEYYEGYHWNEGEGGEETDEEL